MASMKRCKTKYAGVFYIEGTAAKVDKPERIYYIRYRKDGKLIEEKAGRQYQDDMTPARAAGIRAERMEGRQPSNREARKAAEEVKQCWTLGKLWEEYRAQLRDNMSTRSDLGRYENHLQQPFGDKEPGKISKLDIDRLRISLLKLIIPVFKHSVGIV
jgi:hypothetical protein